MKHLFLTVIMAVSFVSCSGNDDNTAPEQTNPVSTQYFHPPAWIQGSWKISGTTTSYFKFTADDFILVSPYTSYKNILEQTASIGQPAKLTENITDYVYDFTMVAGISSGTYKFKKINATRIQWVSANSQQPVYLDKE